MFLFSSSASASAFGGPPVPVPSPPNCLGSIGCDAAAGARRRAAVHGRGAARRRVALDADEDDVRAARLRGTSLTWSLLLPSSAVNLPFWTSLSRNPMWPSAPKSFWPPQS